MSPLQSHRSLDSGETHSSTDESDVDGFLDYARDLIAENDLSYDSTSFRDFETLLQECIANHFLDFDGDADSMTSELTYSGYVNEPNDVDKRTKTCILEKKGIISDQSYHRMKGIIARKKQTSASQSTASDVLHDLMVGSNNAESSCSFGLESNCGAEDATSVTGCMPDVLFPLPRQRTEYESDSSGSQIEDRRAQRIRRRKIRKRANIKKRLRGESISQDTTSSTTTNNNSADKERLSLLLKSPKSKEKTLRYLREHAPSLYDSVVARLERSYEFRKPKPTVRQIENDHSLQNYYDASTELSKTTSSEFEIDSTNGILPSLVRKGILYCDIPRIEKTLERKIQKVHDMTKKETMLSQLIEIHGWESETDNVTMQRGMALAHKLRSQKKIALQAAFLRSSGEGHCVPETKQNLQSTRIDLVEHEPPEFSSFHPQAEEQTAAMVQHNALLTSPESPSHLSSVEERRRFQTIFHRTKRTLSYATKCHEKQSLLQTQMPDDFQTFNSTSRMNDIVSPSKMPPFKKMIFSRSKTDSKYEELSAESSISCASSNDSYPDIVSPIFNDTASDKYDAVKMHQSDDSQWSEMSFHSGSHGFSGSPVSSFMGKRNHIQHSRTDQRLRPTPIDTQNHQGFNDSFDEIVQRKTPKAPGTKNGIDPFEVEPSPTGVMDVFSSSHQKGQPVGDALAFVDDDEEDFLFTDKEDSFVMKSSESLTLPQICHPLFFSPTRFEI